VGGLVLGLLLVAASVAAAFIRVPYIIISPGSATALDRDVVSISGAPTYDHDGDFLYLTVSVTNRDPNVWRWLFAELDGDLTVEKRADVIGCASYAESQQLATIEMEESQDVAKTVALRTLGYVVPDKRSQPIVVAVACDGPSRGRLELGDVITAVDGQPVATAADVRPLVVAHRPGEHLTVAVDRAGQSQDVRIRLGGRGGAAFLGIATSTDEQHEIPVDVAIDTNRVSGPSAGLAFTLAIIDDLTPGNLTGGRTVAVTGTIASDGSVGPVGGVTQKAITAKRSGARMMLVPAAEADEAREHANGMQIVSVATLDDALAALQRAGGAALSGVGSTPPVTAGQ
jgi:PDZ domain-containing protein